MPKKRTMQVKPLKKIIRDPVTMTILPTDKWSVVPYVSYWIRRIMCGDVEQHKDDQQKSPEPDKPAKVIKMKQSKKEG